MAAHCCHLVSTAERFTNYFGSRFAGGSEDAGYFHGTDLFELNNKIPLNRIHNLLELSL
jgi:hypothetical protein